MRNSFANVYSDVRNCDGQYFPCCAHLFHNQSSIFHCQASFPKVCIRLYLIILNHLIVIFSLVLGSLNIAATLY